MRTAQIAKLAHVHPNTVRLYEEWGYISPVPREENGYRRYSPIHLQQMRIARLAFSQEFIQNNLRKKATKIVQLAGAEKFEQALVAAQQYEQFLQSEYAYAVLAVETANEILNRPTIGDAVYRHQDVAKKLQLTEETIRNWERNGLFTVARNAQNRRQYSEHDLQKLLIIRTLRSAHFSITSIRQLFEEIEQIADVTDIHALLNSPAFYQEFYHVTDELETNLKRAIADVVSIIELLQALRSS